MSPKLRRLLLTGVLAAGVAAFALSSPPEPTAKPAAGADARAPAAKRAPEALELPVRRSLGAARADLFGAPATPRPSVVAAAPPPPAAEVAPPLPYRFAGRVRRGAEEELLLSKGERVFPVKEGETLDGLYRVLSVRADAVELVYLPLGTTERLAAGSLLDAEPPAPVFAAVPAPVSP